MAKHHYAILQEDYAARAQAIKNSLDEDFRDPILKSLFTDLARKYEEISLRYQALAVSAGVK